MTLVRKITLPFVSLLVLFLLADASGLVARQDFVNVTSDMGIEHSVIDNHIPDMGSGLSFIDIDGNSFDDLVITNGQGFPFSVYLNEDGSSFTKIDLSLPNIEHNDSQMVAWADYDNDGDKDFYVSYSLGTNRLYRNEGNLVFEDVTTASGMDQMTPNSSGVIWTDFDNDGYLDLFLSTQLETGEVLPDQGGRHFLYHNNGDGSFSEIAGAAGVFEAKLALTTASFDYDQDGLMDIYVANDKDLGNQMFRNLGDMTFSDVSRESGTGVAMSDMGIAISDIDNDGFFDMYLTNTPEGNVLLYNNGDGTFNDVALEQKVTVNYICWGALFFDFDLDGWEDLHVAVSGEDYTGGGETRNKIFRNLNASRFVKSFSDQTEFEPATNPVRSWGSAASDFNKDGLVDLAVYNNDGNFALWKNEFSSTNNWVAFTVEGTRSNRDGIGAQIIVYTGDLVQRRLVNAATSYRSQSSSRYSVGLAENTQADSVQVKWPSGVLDTWYGLESGQAYLLKEATTDTDESLESPEEFVLGLSAFPNPFASRLAVRVDFPQGEVSQLLLSDLSGRQIRSWLLQNAQIVNWDGLDENGDVLARGSYILTQHLKSGRQASLLVTKL